MHHTLRPTCSKGIWNSCLLRMSAAQICKEHRLTYCVLPARLHRRNTLVWGNFLFGRSWWRRRRRWGQVSLCRTLLDQNKTGQSLFCPFWPGGCAFCPPWRDFYSTITTLCSYICSPFRILGKPHLSLYADLSAFPLCLPLYPVWSAKLSLEIIILVFELHRVCVFDEAKSLNLFIPSKWPLEAKKQDQKPRALEEAGPFLCWWIPEVVWSKLHFS